MSELQRERLRVLMGARWRQGDVQVIRRDQAKTRDENVLKVVEMFKELMLEAKRAP
jgi:hypothetical protein